MKGKRDERLLDSSVARGTILVFELRMGPSWLIRNFVVLARYATSVYT